MTKEELEGNELIAKSPFSNLVRGSSIEERWYIKDNGQQGYFTELKYHSSWDWLMPVVEKIYKMYKWDKFYYNPSMAYFYLSTKIKIFTGSKDDDFGTCGDMEYRYIKCEAKYAVYKAVIEFIKWYNSQKL